ncbi:MAG: Ig-like domain-containing protein [Deltaproteobacteria bacterium]|nr:Ig-like domain-containing protein [Deltaproteobacteria bacterium]
MRVIIAAGLVILAGCSSGGTSGSGSSGTGTTGTHCGGSAASVIVQPNALSLTVGQTRPLSAQARDACGNDVGATPTWQSDAPTLFSVSPDGQVTGLAPGSGTVEAHAGSAVGIAQITVLAGGSSGSSSGSTSTGATGGSSGGNSFIVAVTIVGAGEVHSVPVGLDCGANTSNTCSVTFPSGTALELNATPEGSGTFLGWSGVSCVDNPCNVDVTGNLTITATFQDACPTPAGCVWFDGGACPPSCCEADWACGSSGICRVTEGNGTVPSGSYCVDPPATQRFCNSDSDCVFGDVCAIVRDGSGCPCTKECMAPLGDLPPSSSCGAGLGDCANGLCLDDGQETTCATLCGGDAFSTPPCFDGGFVCATLPGNPSASCVVRPADFRIWAQAGSFANIRTIAPLGNGQALLAGVGEVAETVDLAQLRFTGGTFGIADPRAQNYSGATASSDMICLLDGDAGSVTCGPQLGATYALPDGGVLVPSGVSAIGQGSADPSHLYTLSAAGVQQYPRDGGWYDVPTVIHAGALDFMAVSDQGVPFGATIDGTSWLGSNQLPSIPTNGLVTATAFGPIPLATDDGAELWVYGDAGWSVAGTVVASPMALAANGAGNVLAAGAEGLWAGDVTGAGTRVWRDVRVVGFVPGAPDGGDYQVAIDRSGYLLVRP